MGTALASGLVGSLTMGAGQFCTNPGLVIAVDGPELDTFIAAAREAQLECLGDLISGNVDRDALLRLIYDGPPSGLPVVKHQVSGLRVQVSGTGCVPETCTPVAYKLSTSKR